MWRNWGGLADRSSVQHSAKANTFAIVMVLDGRLQRHVIDSGINVDNALAVTV